MNWIDDIDLWFQMSVDGVNHRTIICVSSQSFTLTLHSRKEKEEEEEEEKTEERDSLCLRLIWRWKQTKNKRTGRHVNITNTRSSDNVEMFVLDELTELRHYRRFRRLLTSQSIRRKRQGRNKKRERKTFEETFEINQRRKQSDQRFSQLIYNEFQSYRRQHFSERYLTVQFFFRRSFEIFFSLKCLPVTWW